MYLKAEQYTELGYRKVSNKYKNIARIDNEDWINIIYNTYYNHRTPAIKEAVKSYYNGIPFEDFGFMEKTVKYEAGMVADMYRRMVTQDIIENIPYEIFKNIPTSSFDPIGFVQIEV